MTYKINKTNILESAIDIQENSIDSTFDIVLFGRKKLNYGQQLNENVLHLLERFACPEDSGNPGNPNLLQVSDLVTGKKLLSTPTNGQLWYNSTTESLYVWVSDNNAWEEISSFGDVAATWGIMSHGSQLPLPVSTSGYVFSYDECSWIVSPQSYGDLIEYMHCITDSVATVDMTYRYPLANEDLHGQVMYLIVGIKGNVNIGQNTSPITYVTPQTTPPASAPAVSPTPTPTPSTIDIITTSYTGIWDQAIQNISAICDISGYTITPDNGVINCTNGTKTDCALYECAPEPGDSAQGVQMRVQVTGGTAPYTVRIKNLTGANGIPVGECIDMSFNGVTLINKDTLSSETLATFNIATDGGIFDFGKMVASCGSTLYSVSGTFDIEVQDDVGEIYTETRNWTSARVNTGKYEES
jgi:hypothetical protein